MSAKNPILLDSSLNDLEMLNPTKGSLNLKMCGVSELSLTLPADAANVPMHSWIKVFNQKGFVGYYRRTSNNRNFPTDQAYTFRHGIDILQDSIWNAETEFSGTKTQFLTQLLDQQTHLINGVKPWVLGTCADSSTMKKSINYDNLMELLNSMEDEGGDYYFSYDQTVWPWQISFLQRPGSVASEFRFKRNMEKCRISENDSELCTRLILNVNAMTADAELGTDQNKSVVRTYNNTTAQATYGIIIKTEDIDTTDTLPNGPFTEADAFAAKFLAARSAPLVTVQIDGYELFKQSGDTWDESKIGALCRVAIPDYATYISQRVTAVSYPDLFNVPDRVTVTLSNATPQTLRDRETLTSSVSSNSASTARLSRGGRASAREEENFVKHFTLRDRDGTILKQAGMILDAQGQLVYADDNVNMVGSRFNVQADKIGMVVGTHDGVNYVKGGEIALSLNQQEDKSWESRILLEADIIDINGLVLALKTKDLTCKQFTCEQATVSTGNLSVPEGTINGKTITADGRELKVIDASKSGNTLTITTKDGTISFSKAAALQTGYGGDNTGDTATYTVTGTPSENFPSGNTVTGSFVLHISSAAAWVTDPNGTIRARVANSATTAAYNQGWNECRQWALDHNAVTVLTGYSKYNQGNLTALYVAPTVGAQKATNYDQRWTYGGTETTRYTLPAAK